MTSLEAIQYLYAMLLVARAEQEEKREQALQVAIESLEDRASRDRDVVQRYHDYQIDYMKDAYEKDIEDLIRHFIHDTANIYMLEMQKRADDD